MKVMMRDQEIELSGDCTLAKILARYPIELDVFALALNGTFIPRSKYEEIKLKPNDRIDIVTPMQGG